MMFGLFLSLFRFPPPFLCRLREGVLPSYFSESGKRSTWWDRMTSLRSFFRSYKDAFLPPRFQRAFQSIIGGSLYLTGDRDQSIPSLPVHYLRSHALFPMSQQDPPREAIPHVTIQTGEMENRASAASSFALFIAEKTEFDPVPICQISMTRTV